MSYQGVPTQPRRPELEKAYQHLMTVAEGVDLSGVTSPADQWLATTRATVMDYGGSAPPADLSDVTFTPVKANGVACEWVTVEGSDPARRIVYMHGGGWSAGGGASHRPILAVLARLSRASILFADYRLAPEHPYPAPLADCVAAYEFALVNGPSSDTAGLAGRDPKTRISVAGDSAGGNLSVATCVRLAKTGRPLPDRLVAIGGSLDNVSMWERVGVDDMIVTPEALAFSAHHYLAGGGSAAEPEVSPVLTPPEILAKFPPTLLQVSTIEALLHDSKRFAERLERAGVRVNLSLWPDVPHVWHAFVGLFPEAEAAIGEVADFVNR